MLGRGEAARTADTKRVGATPTARRDRTPLLCLLSLVLGVAAVSDGRAAAPAAPNLIIRGGGAERLSAALHELLGAPVTVRLGRERRVTIVTRAQSLDEMLDQVARAIRGTWRRTLHVETANAISYRGANAPQGAYLTVNIQQVQPRSAFTILARSARARLAADKLPSTPVNLALENASVEEALDRLTRALDLRWHYSYEILGPAGGSQVVAVTPAPITSALAPPPDANSPSPRLAPFSALPTASPGPRLPPGRARDRTQAGLLPRLPTTGPPVFSATTSVQLREGLRTELRDLLRTDPSARAEAVTRFVVRVSRLFTQLDELKGAERNLSLIALRQVRTTWEAIYAGLAPSVQREFQPVTELFRQRLPR